MQQKQHWSTIRWQQLTLDERRESIWRANCGRAAATLRTRIERAIDAGLLTSDGRRELAAVLLAGVDK